jgi:hypothetical protein
VLTIVTNGVGKVVPNLGGQDLEDGKAYTFTATAGRGNVFSNWTGSILTAAQTIHVIMEPDFVLEANFIPNPFVPVAGKYVGIFEDTNQPALESSGLLTLNLKSSGSYSGSIARATNRYSFTGRFDVSGFTTTSFQPKGTGSRIGLVLQLGSGKDAGFITGSVSNAEWTATVVASLPGFNAKTNPATEIEGKYTFIITTPGETNSLVGTNGSFLGDGFGTITVNAKGRAMVHGTLPDGFKFSQSMYVNSDGEWPLFVSLANGAELFYGIVGFEDDGISDLSGTATWIVTSHSNNMVFPTGNTNVMQIIGSRYIKPARHERILDFVNGVVTLQGGGLAAPETNLFALRDNNTIYDNGLDHLSLTFNSGTGLFHGHMRPPGFATPINFQGAVLQKAVYGSGFYLTTNSTGRVTIEMLGAAPPPLGVGIVTATTNVQAGDLVEFTANFNEAATNWVWDFNDGTDDVTNVSPLTHAWTNGGDYTVTLTAYNATTPDGASNQIIMHVVPTNSVTSDALSSRRFRR